MGAGGECRRRGDRSRPGRRARRRRGLPALHLGHDGAAQGCPAPALRPDREHVEYRRAPASAPRRQALARGLALLGPRLRERAFRGHDPRGLRGAAGAFRRRPRASPDRGRALHRLLRHTQHGARAGAPSRAAGARHFLAAHRGHAGLARADQAPDRPRRERDLQHLRADGDLRQFQRHRRGRPAGEAAQHGRPAAAGHGNRHCRPRKPRAAA